MESEERDAGQVEELTASLRPYLPVNPIPFARALMNGVRENGRDCIRSDEAKALMHSLNQMAYGQCYELDGGEEFIRLAKIFGKPDQLESNSKLQPL